jgi:predicted O-linked N-acetylglucosamine transferase (SPINDLY family)
MKKGRSPSGAPPSHGRHQPSKALSPKAQQLFDQGQQCATAGDFDGAATAFRQVVEMRPDVHQAQFNLGRALVMLGRDADALVPLQKTLLLQPGHTKALLYLAPLQGRLDNQQESVRLFERALRLDPRNAQLMGEFALSLAAMERDDEAVATFQRALAIAPDLPQLHFNLGNLIRKFKGDAASVPHFLRAVELKPDYARALSSLGQLHHRSAPDKAGAYYRRAIASQPDYLHTFYGLIALEQRYCDFNARDETYGKLLAALRNPDLRPLTWQTAANLAYESIFAPYPLEALRALQDHIAAKLTRETANQGPLPPLPAAAPAAGHRLRIGYLSPNFANHPVGQVTLSLFPAHDRQRFELHAFSTEAGGPEDSEEARIHRGSFEFFHEIGGMKPKEAAAFIRARGIDILVDLDGYMDTTSPPILAFRPAPLQVFWLGHAGGLGLPFVDYLIADAVVVPPGEEPQYREAVVRLPEIYHCADRHPVAESCPPRAAFNLPETGTVYCVFNNPDKIDRTIFECWMRILRQVEGSVLWFSAFRQNRDMLVANLRRYAEKHGVDPDRLILSERVPDKAGHLARIGHADLMLDTVTLNASTTALDSLWAGVPLIAVRGDRFSNRISNSMLRAIGMEDLVCADLAEYERRAVELGKDRAACQALRERLRANRETTPLFDIQRFTRHLERAYEAMWDRYSRGDTPAGIDLPL